MRPLCRCWLRLFHVSDLAGFVNVFAREAKFFYRRLNVSVWNINWFAFRNDLAPFLCRAVNSARSVAVSSAWQRFSSIFQSSASSASPSTTKAGILTVKVDSDRTCSLHSVPLKALLKWHVDLRPYHEHFDNTGEPRTCAGAPSQSYPIAIRALVREPDAAARILQGYRCVSSTRKKCYGIEHFGRVFARHPDI